MRDRSPSALTTQGVHDEGDEAWSRRKRHCEIASNEVKPLTAMYRGYMRNLLISVLISQGSAVLAFKKYVSRTEIILQFQFAHLVLNTRFFCLDLSSLVVAVLLFPLVLSGRRISLLAPQFVSLLALTVPQVTSPGLIFFVWGGFIHDTSCLPPFRVGSSWVSIDDDVTNGFALPSVKSLFRTWRCCLDLDALVRGGLSVPWSPLPLLRSLRSSRFFGCRGASGCSP